ncbi:PAS domain-containing protein [Streptomyces coeruleoprunus]|uniref:PAS domain-containing protein n=1 Tax=Streptomyces coeruleoprunus TaxID=285563 RepID=A0ABV9XB13_9ACTN
MSGTGPFGEDLADFVRRVAELRNARALPPEEQQGVLDAALFELQHAAETLWPRYERLAARGPEGAPAERQERQLLKTLFQRLPLAVALVDRDTVVRRMNFAAMGLTGVRAGYATGRPLAALLTPGDRAPFRTQVAATARGEGGRSMTVRLQQRPLEPVRATLAALPLPDEPQPAVVVVLQPGVTADTPRPAAADRSASGDAVRVAARRPAVPDLAEATRRAGTLDLVDTVASELLRRPAGDAEAALEAAARALHGRFADWVIADVTGEGPARRVVVLGPPDAEGGPLLKAVAEQEPEACPLVAQVARDGSASLQVRPEDTLALGTDADGAAVLVRSGVSSLLCVPLVGGAADEGHGVLGVLTLLRTGARRAFSMAEGQAADIVSRHVALAMRRPTADPPGWAGSPKPGGPGAEPPDAATRRPA